MNLKNEIWNQLESNRDLRLKIALSLNIGELAVDKNIRNKSTVLTKYAALKAIAEYRNEMISDLITDVIENETTTTH